MAAGWLGLTLGLERARWFFTEIVRLYVTKKDDERIFLRA